MSRGGPALFQRRSDGMRSMPTTSYIGGLRICDAGTHSSRLCDSPS